MISPTFAHLRSLQCAAVEAVRKIRAVSSIEFASTPSDVLAAAIETRDALTNALLIAQYAGVFAQVDAIVSPAKPAINALIAGCREEIETRRAG